MSYPLTELSSSAFNHRTSTEIESEYDHLRDQARAEADKRNSCFARSREAYSRGDGAEAKELSNQGKRHAAKMEEFNRRASEFIFRENNAVGRVEEDCIDLHGQFAEEAENILEQRIRADVARGANHLHVIVGKGNHSAGGVQKIKPRVEELCRELNLKFSTEENAGRIYVNLKGGEAIPPPRPTHPHSGGRPHQQPHQQQPYHGGQQQPYHGGQQQPYHGGQQQPYHGGQQQPYHGGQQQQQPQESDNGLLGLLFKQLEKVCCSVM